MRARLLGHEFGQRRGGQRAGIVLGGAHRHLAQLGVRQGRNLVADGLGGAFGLVGAAGDALRGGVVDHHEDNVRQRRAILLLVGGVGHGDEQRERRQPPQPPAAQAAPQRERHEQGR